MVIFLVILSSHFQTAHAQPRRESIAFDGLSLSETETLTITNKVVTINGQITLSGQSTLIITNSSFTINSHPRKRGTHESEIILLDEAELILEDVDVHINVDLEPNYHTNGRLKLRNSSKIKIINSKISCSNQLTMQVSQESNAYFNNSTLMGKAPHSNTHFALEDILPTNLLRHLYDDYHVSVSGKANLNIQKSNMGAIFVENNATCTISGSNIANLSPASTKKTYVSNSILTILKLGKREGQFSYTGNHQSHHENWDTEELFGKGIFSGDVKIVDSSIQLIWLSLSYCEAEIKEADLGILSLYGGHTTISASNLWVVNNRNEKPLQVKNSQIEYLTGWSESPTVDLVDSYIGWLGLTGSGVITVNASNSEFDTCKLYNLQKPDKLVIGIRNSNIQNLELKTGKNTILDFNNTVVTERISLTKSEPHDQISVKSGPKILPKVEVIREASILFEHDKDNTRAQNYPISYGLVAMILIIIVIIRAQFKSTQF
jgi:hypothetical protein